MKCPHCGSYNPRKSKWCSQCGSAISIPFLKRFLLFLLRLFIWFITTVVMLWLAGFIFPSSDAGTKLPDWYSILVLAVPIISAIFCDRIKLKSFRHEKKDQESKNPQSNNKMYGFLKRFRFFSNDSPIAQYNLPLRQADRIASVQKLHNDVKEKLKLAYGSDSVILYFLWIDDAKKILSELKKYNGTVPSKYEYQTDFYLRHLESDFQWKLRDVIEREKIIALSDIRHEYRNNKRSRCEDFVSTLNMHISDYDMETLQFCTDAVNEVARASGIPISFAGSTSPETSASSSPVTARTASNIEIVDRMEGHEFENWCAQLLSDIGFSGVTVTKGSGDQGVDIIAKRGGISYAIQCKCYSSNLGNSPVQEVSAGRTFYHCQVGAVMTNRYFTSGACELANSNGILLWDRTWLENAIISRIKNEPFYN